MHAMLDRIGGSLVAGVLLVAPADARIDERAGIADGTECENYDPKWSPDGREIAFMVRRDSRDIFVVSVDGTGERRPLRLHDVHE